MKDSKADEIILAFRKLTDNPNESLEFSTKKGKQHFANLLVDEGVKPVVDAFRALQEWYGCPNGRVYKHAHILKKTAAPLHKKEIQIFRGVRTNVGLTTWNTYFKGKKPGAVLELPPKTDIKACSCTTCPKIAKAFASNTTNGVVLELIDPEADIIVAPPRFSKKWFNDIMNTYFNSHYRKSEKEVIVAPPAHKKTIKFKWIETKT